MHWVRRLSLHDVNDLYAEWAENPPLRTMVANYLGYGAQKESKVKDTLDYGGAVKPASDLPDYLKNQ